MVIITTIQNFQNDTNKNKIKIYTNIEYNIFIYNVFIFIYRKKSKEVLNGIRRT